MVMRPPRVSVGGVDIDPCDIPVPLTITYGASDMRNQPDAPSCTFQVEGEPLGGARSLALGQAVEVDALHTDGFGTTIFLPRFRGRVSDLTVDRSGAYAATSVTAIGYQADLANQVVGDMDLGHSNYPAQTAEQRYQRIRQDLDQAFRPHVPAPGNDVAWPAVDVPPADAEGGSALEMMLDVAVTVRGRIVETPAGLIKLRIDPQNASGATVHCEEIVDQRQWAVTAGDIINSVTVSGFGPDPYEPVQRTVNRATNIPQFGTRHQDIGTLIVDSSQQRTKLADYARAVLDDWAQPRWMMPQITVDCTAMMDRDGTGNAWSWFMKMEPWQTILVAQTAPAPVPPAAPETRMIVLGWTETWSATDDGKVQQDMQIALGHDTAGMGTSATLVNLGPAGTPTRGQEWQIKVRLLSTITGLPVSGYVHAEIVGPGTRGPEASTDADRVGLVTVPAVDAENVSINVVSSIPGAEFSARYPLA